MSNDNFDPFGNEATALPESVFYGEIVLYRGYQGIKIRGERGFPEYDAQNPDHQSAVAEGKKVYACYELQHFPIGVNFETYPMQLPIWDDVWKRFEQSFADCLGLDATDKKQRGELYSIYMRNLTNGGNFFRYETPVIRIYKKQDGTEGKIRGIVVLEKYPNEQAMIDASNMEEDEKMDAFNQSVPVAKREIQILPREQAVGFIAALATQCNSWGQLQEKIDAMPMLGELKIDDDDVREQAATANPAVFNVAF